MQLCYVFEICFSLIPISQLVLPMLTLQRKKALYIITNRKMIIIDTKLKISIKVILSPGRDINNDYSVLKTLRKNNIILAINLKIWNFCP